MLRFTIRDLLNLKSGHYLLLVAVATTIAGMAFDSNLGVIAGAALIVAAGVLLARSDSN